MKNKKLQKIIGIIGIILIIFYIILIFSAKKIETLASFPGTVINVQDVVGHVKSNPNFEEINIPVGDDNLNGLYLGSGSGKTVYYFHGNGGPLPYFYSEIEYIHDLGYNVMAYDYPGYGESTGTPHKEKVGEFSQIFYKHVIQEKNINSEDIIIWGYSVGTAVATDFASQNNFDKIVLVAPFASRYDMGKSVLGFPLQKLLFRKNTFITKEKVKEFSQPGLIIHGNQDNIIDFAQGKTVFKNYGQNSSSENQKYFIEIDGFGHNLIIDIYGSTMEAKIREFLKTGTVSGESNEFFLDADARQEWEKESILYRNIYSADLESDESITKFVNSSVSFTDKTYVPKNLVSFASDYLGDGKGNGKLRSDIIPELNDLGKEFYNEFGRKLLINSSYRSYNYQQGIKDRGCPDNLCAKAGYSEHQSGLGFDIFSITTEQVWKNNTTLWSYYTWLDENAHLYGFHNTYQKGLEIDGYEIEPWHWRYLGKDLATYLKENNLTIAEFYYSQKDPSN